MPLWLLLPLWCALIQVNALPQARTSGERLPPLRVEATSGTIAYFDRCQRHGGHLI